MMVGYFVCDEVEARLAKIAEAFGWTDDEAFERILKEGMDVLEGMIEEGKNEQ